MPTHALTLDDEHFRAAEEKARSLGQTPEQYVQALIDADSRSFDQILDPIRQGFDPMNDSEIDQLMDRAQRAAREGK